jgi:hypothetical protein
LFSAALLDAPHTLLKAGIACDCVSVMPFLFR